MLERLHFATKVRFPNSQIPNASCPAYKQVIESNFYSTCGWMQDSVGAGDGAPRPSLTYEGDYTHFGELPTTQSTNTMLQNMKNLSKTFDFRPLSSFWGQGRGAFAKKIRLGVSLFFFFFLLYIFFCVLIVFQAWAGGPRPCLDGCAAPAQGSWATASRPPPTSGAIKVPVSSSSRT